MPRLPAQFETAHLRAYVWHPYGYSELTGVRNVSWVNRSAALFPPPHVGLVKMKLEARWYFLAESRSTCKLHVIWYFMVYIGYFTCNI